MNASKFILALVLFVFLTSTGLIGQSDVKFNVKIKPGLAVAAFHENELTAISSKQDILIIGNSTGTSRKILQGHRSAINDLDISEDDELLLSASDDKTLIVWDTKTGRILQQFSGHSRSVNKARFIDNERIVSISSDNSMIIWSIKTGQKLSTFSDQSGNLKSLSVGKNYFAVGDSKGEIVVRSNHDGEVAQRIMCKNGIGSLLFEPDGRRLISGTNNGMIQIWDIPSGKLFNSVKSGNSGIFNLDMSHDDKHFVVSSSTCKIYNLESLSLVKEIDKVSSAVLDAAFTVDGSGLFFIEEYSPKARCWDIAHLKLTKAITIRNKGDKASPQIFIASPQKIIDGRVILYQDLISIKGSVIDDSGIHSLKINGIQTPFKQNGRFVINLPLSPGDNYVTIEASDVNDNISIKKFVVNRKNIDGEEYNPTFATNYLVVIGVNKYEHWPVLNNAVKDAKDVLNTLISLYNFEFGNITLLTDEKATRQNIYETLRAYVNQVGPKDNLVIYYSGHGHFDSVLNEGYWVPVEARTRSNGDYLSNSDISKIIANINSQHTFLVADACFSGSLFNEKSRGYAENVEKFRSRWGLASGRLETVSDGEIGKNSPFTSSFLKYLKENKKEKVAVSELVQYVKINVAEMSKQTPIGNPLKGVGDEGGEFVFYKRKQ